MMAVHFPDMFDRDDKETLLEEVKGEYEAQMAEGERTCEAEGCESQSFDVNLYVASPSSYKGTAVCRKCNKRHEITKSVKGMDEEIADAEREIQDELDDLGS